MLETLVDYNNHHNATLYNEKLRQATSTVISETELEERNIILYANNVNMDTFCQSPVTINTQGQNENTIFTSERRNTSDILAETQSTTLHIII